MNEDDRSDPLTHRQRRARRPSGSETRLRRSRHDRVVAGLAGGVASFIGADPRRVRAVFVVTIPLSLGLTVAGYLVFWAIVPSEA